MALEPCRECGREVSTEAQTCPHCGVGHPAGVPEPPRAPAQGRRRVWSSLGCLGLLLLLLWIIGEGGRDQPPPLALGQSYRVKRSMVACPSGEALDRLSRLLIAKDVQAARVFMVRSGCLMLQLGWDVIYDGQGGFGVVKVRRPGDPDVLFTPQESIGSGR